MWLLADGRHAAERRCPDCDRHDMVVADPRALQIWAKRERQLLETLEELAAALSTREAPESVPPSGATPSACRGCRSRAWPLRRPPRAGRRRRVRRAQRDRLAGRARRPVLRATREIGRRVLGRAVAGGGRRCPPRALLRLRAPAVRPRRVSPVAGAAYGLAPYAVNFRVLAPRLWPEVLRLRRPCRSCSTTWSRGALPPAQALARRRR